MPLGFGDNSFGKCFVYSRVAIFPGVMYCGVNVRCVWGTPHIVLKEPEERVAKYVVILVVYTSRGDYVSQA